MKVVVTGGQGLLGRFVVQALLSRASSREAHEVTVLDQTSATDVGNVRYVTGDVRDLGQVFDVLAGSDAVIHLAAIRKPGVAADVTVFDTNVRGTFNVYEAALRLGLDRVIATSSEAALGWDYREADFLPEYLPIDEEHPLRPQDPYGLSKVVGEEIARSHARRGLSTIVIRPPWIVTPETLSDLAASGGRRVGRFTLASYVDVRDLADAYVSALHVPHRGFDVVFAAADDSVIAEPLCQFMPRMLPSIGDMASTLTGTNAAVRNDRAKELLRWRPGRSWRTSSAITARKDTGG